MPTSAAASPGRHTLLGLFLISLATLTYQILLTRIFSVTMWYHFAFMAISVTMFGMSAGALWVYLRPSAFPLGRTAERLTSWSLWFAVTIVATFLLHVLTPAAPDTSGRGLVVLTLTFLIASIPFVCSGVAVCLALTRFPRDVPRLYAADLCGAAVGCVLVVLLLRLVDGPTAVLVVAALAAAGAMAFGWTLPAGRWSRAGRALVLSLVALAVVNGALARVDRPLLRLFWVKGEWEPRPLYERWNSFSRIRVAGNPEWLGRPFGWGMSDTLPEDVRVRQLGLNIDGSAYTVLTRFDGDTGALDYLKYDVTNLAHYVRRDARVVVVGAGGGRDVLSALAFGQRSVVGLEINENILRTVNHRFREFTGRLDARPDVRFVNDEARSYLARSREEVDIIQISLIDTWAATASGAFVLAENSLYTVEAWVTFLERLAPDGILTVSRWYFADRPGEVYRMATLAAAALERFGVHEPGPHMAIVRTTRPHSPRMPEGVGTLLLSRRPLSAADLEEVRRVAERMDFAIVQAPGHASDPTLAAIASGQDIARVIAESPLNIAPPTDDSPFFFHMLRVQDVFSARRWTDQGSGGFNLRAVALLGSLLATVSVLAGLVLVAPLAAGRRAPLGLDALPLVLFFAAIGFGFLLIEISQLQRLIVFLGHPTYSLSVVLFSLLLAGGIGSATVGWMGEGRGRAAGALALLVAVLVLFGLATPHLVAAFDAAGNAVRILVAVAVLIPIGFFMGMPFPLGMRLAASRAPALTPWFWAINGATSIVASVLAIVLALGWGISAAFWAGVVCYVAAAGAFVLADRGPRVPARPRRAGG
jgi:hypothetical protein